MTEFWAKALNYQLQPPPEGFDTWDAFADAQGIPEEKRGDISAVVDPNGEGPRLLFLRVPESKTVKNRVHLDINVSNEGSNRQDKKQEVLNEEARLVKAGATRLNEIEGESGYWIVMSDPEGNEFCIQ